MITDGHEVGRNDVDWSAIDHGLTNNEWYRDEPRHDEFRLLRDLDPMHRTEPFPYGQSFWAITRYDDVRTVLGDPVNFSSSHMYDASLLREPRRFSALERRAAGMDTFAVLMDPSGHTRYRQPLNKSFGGPAMRKMEDAVDRIGDEVIASVAGRPEVEFVEEVCGMFAMRLVLDFQGVPESDWTYLRDLVARRVTLSQVASSPSDSR